MHNYGKLKFFLATIALAFCISAGASEVKIIDVVNTQLGKMQLINLAKVSIQSLLYEMYIECVGHKKHADYCDNAPKYTFDSPEVVISNRSNNVVIIFPQDINAVPFATFKSDQHGNIEIKQTGIGYGTQQHFIDIFENDLY